MVQKMGEMSMARMPRDHLFMRLRRNLVFQMEEHPAPRLYILKVNATVLWSIARVIILWHPEAITRRLVASVILRIFISSIHINSGWRRIWECTGLVSASMEWGTIPLTILQVPLSSILICHRILWTIAPHLARMIPEVGINVHVLNASNSIQIQI